MEPEGTRILSQARPAKNRRRNFNSRACGWYAFSIVKALLTSNLTSSLVAVNGLDDLRGWTLEGVIQPSIDIYLTQQTLADISRAFPYLVSKEHASGGGDVRYLRFDATSSAYPLCLRSGPCFIIHPG